MWNFNPRAPCGARHDGGVPKVRSQHISIHAPHAGRDDAVDRLFVLVDISIHAPHAGRDERVVLTGSGEWISIHAPHAGRDCSLRSKLR